MPETPDIERRDLAVAISRGARGRCPNCGNGTLFRGFLQVADRCEACGEAFHHHRADDAPAYLTILIVGHLMLPVVLGVEEFLAPALWITCFSGARSFRRHAWRCSGR